LPHRWQSTSLVADHRTCGSWLASDEASTDKAVSSPNKKGSSRIAGKVILDLHEKEFAVSVAVGHPLDHLDPVVDAL
jgi:hypothetical protein